MTATTPYLVRAIHQWCSEQGFTPYLLVDTTVDGVAVPMNLVTDGTIVLNLDFNAVYHLEMGNEWILFSARFGGKSRNINIPIAAVRAVYAKENGQGCLFTDSPTAQKTPALANKKPELKTAGLKATGTKVASTKATGIKAADIKAAGIKATGIKAAGIKAAGKPKPPAKTTAKTPTKTKPSLKLV